MIIGISGKKQSGKDLVGKIIQYLFYMKKEIKGRYYPPDVFIKELEYNVDLTIESGWEIRKFADKLKDIVCLLIGCTREQLENEEFKNTELGEEWFKTIWWIKSNHNNLEKFNTREEAEKELPYYEGIYIEKVFIASEDIMLTPRLILQLLGTECGRQIIHPNIWVTSTFTDYKGDNGIVYPNWLITDVRFRNEVEAIKDKKGIVIRVNRPSWVKEQEQQILKGVWNYKVKEHESETALDEYKNFDYIVNNDSSIENLIDKVKEILIKEKLI
jgi:hypothetical protein